MKPIKKATPGTNIHMGEIQQINAQERYGVIADQDEMLFLYFDFDDVSIGYPTPGETVQYVREETDTGPIAKRVMVLSDVARGKSASEV